ncbi:cytochrome P450 [Panaeolus papilionaceus]|nr:cytochrome P450 [Panaeolus papilionaceus]
MQLTLLQYVQIAVASYAAWKILRRILVKSPLDDIPGPPPASRVKGVIPQIFDANGWDFHRKIWETYGGVTKLHGGVGGTLLYIFDTKAMYQMLVKDQAFQLPDTNILGAKLYFGSGLFAVSGDAHKRQRRLLNPPFSAAHMRDMMPMFHDIGHRLQNSLVNQVKGGPKEIDMVFWMGRAALELIGQSGFGYSFDDLSENFVEHNFSSALKQLVPLAFRLAFLRMFFLKPALKIGTPAFRRKMIDYLPIDSLKKIRDVVDTLHETSLGIYREKKQALENGDAEVTLKVSKGKDILSILMKQNLDAPEEDKLTEEEIHGQISTFTFAGLDTTSNALSRTLWLLAQHSEVQAKLRAELCQAKKKAGGNIPYDELVALPYLDAVCRETMRLYAPITQTMRETKSDTIVPLSKPIKLDSGGTTSEVHVPKGTVCIISLLAANRNKEIWGEDAYEWKPERWLGDMREEVINEKIPGIYSHLMSFGAGGRACIGFKFSQLEMKTVLASLIPKLNFSISQEIAWNMSVIVVPVIASGDRKTPAMPLMVSLVDEDGGGG